MTTEATAGLQLVHDLISCPAQWRVLLALMTGPRTSYALWCQLPSKNRWQLLAVLRKLWSRHLIVFHVKQRAWTLSPTGQSLRPVFTAILTCTET